jgi:VanZ family protein
VSFRTSGGGTSQPRPAARDYAWLTAAFVAFVVYGSLVPLHYQPLSWGEARARWREVLSQPVRVESRSDWAANVLLFIPLGFLGMAALCADRGRAADCWAVPVFAACAAFSASVEFLQLHFPPRVSALNDVVAESIGALLGITAWVVAGRPLTKQARQLWAGAGAQGAATRLLLVYLAVLVFFQAAPLDLSISPTELYHKYKDGMVRPVPFALWESDPQGVVKKALGNVTWFLPVGLLLAHIPRWSRSDGRAAWEVFWLGLLGAAAVEFMQLFVLSRSCDASDVVTGCAAVLAGWAVAHSRGAAWAAVLAWAGALVYLNWLPFDFTFDDHAIRARWDAVSWLPFDDYLQGRYIDVMQAAADKALQFLVLGALLALAAGPEGGQGLLAGLGVAALLAAVLEGGQFLLPTRYASVTDVLVETCGAGLGLWLISRLRAARPRFMTPADVIRGIKWYRV